MDEPTEPTQRPKRTRKEKLLFPVEVTIWMPGAKAPRVLDALWHRREQAASVFGLPEFKRPYMERVLRVPDSSGAVLEILQLSFPQQKEPELHATPPSLPIGVPIPPNAESAVTAAFGGRPLRARVAPGQEPVSEATDEQGNPVIVKAAFGMQVI